ncbi:unnamed protein product [Calicophoron daubneyi]|uniref:Uncharacterized protein n=1 Tax=Calicophoron daubneyi TaxID=300641 RepID=A0AAV2T5U7_CALDB
MGVFLLPLSVSSAVGMKCIDIAGVPLLLVFIRGPTHVGHSNNQRELGSISKVSGTASKIDQ